MKKIWIIALPLVCILSLLIVMAADEIELKENSVVIEYPSIDLNGDGKAESISLVNEDYGTTGKVSMIINDKKYYVSDVSELPESNKYRMTLDYLVMEDCVKLLVRIAHYTNSIGSLDHVYLYDYKNNEPVLFWEENVDKRVELDYTINEDKVTLFHEECEATIDLDTSGTLNPWVTDTMSSSLESRFGDYYLVLNKVIRGTGPFGLYSETYKIELETVTLHSTEMDFD